MTVALTPDVAAAVHQLRRERGIGLSEALNRIARRGLAYDRPAGTPFVQQVSPMSARVDITKVAEALEPVEEPPPR